MIGWLNSTGEADDYFSDERFETECWDVLTGTSGSGVDLKSKLLLNAYNRLFYSKKFLIPASPTPAQLDKLKKAECEMAYYLCIHLHDEDRRKGLQAQAVISAGIVKEAYDADKLYDLPFPPFVLEIMDEFAVVTPPFYATDIDRDEDLAVSDDPTEII